MSSEFHGAYSKLDRAKQHLVEFDCACRDYLSSRPFTLVARFEEKSYSTIYSLGAMPNPPGALSLIAGDTVHNLRSALDHLAFALYRRANPQSPGKHIYFPICENESKYNSEASRRLYGIPSVDAVRINNLKPFGGGDWLLSALHLLDIGDKHQMLVMMNAVNRGAQILPTSNLVINTIYPVLTLREGAALMELHGRPEEHKDIDMKFDLGFALVSLPPRPATSILAAMSNRVQEILDSFSTAA